MKRYLNDLVLNGDQIGETSIAVEIHQERVRAHEKHDEAGMSMEREHFTSDRWLPVVVEEIGEVAKEVVERPHDVSNVTALREQYKARLRKELIQVMAMCSAWVDAIDMDQP